jgi:hypothetical protein
MGSEQRDENPIEFYPTGRSLLVEQKRVPRNEREAAILVPSPPRGRTGDSGSPSHYHGLFLPQVES